MCSRNFDLKRDRRVSDHSVSKFRPLPTFCVNDQTSTSVGPPSTVPYIYRRFSTLVGDRQSVVPFVSGIRILVFLDLNRFLDLLEPSPKIGSQVYR